MGKTVVSPTKHNLWSLNIILRSSQLKVINIFNAKLQIGSTVPLQVVKSNLIANTTSDCVHSETSYINLPDFVTESEKNDPGSVALCGSAPKVNGVHSGSGVILQLNSVEISSVVFV